MKPELKRKTGFTLIELLVVIAIISLLSSVVLASISGTREDARKNAAKNDLRAIRTGIQFLINDTGKWPNGCPPGQTSNPELSLNSSQAGLLSKPSVNTGGQCEWTSADVSQWDGPYMQVENLKDPWGDDYMFDPDYILQSCHRGGGGGGTDPVVYSEGGDNNGINSYECSDIIRNLK